VFVWAPLHRRPYDDGEDDSDEDGDESGYSVASDDDDDGESADTKAARYGAAVLEACQSLRLFIGLRTARMNVTVRKDPVQGIYRYMLVDNVYKGVRVNENEFRYIDPDDPCTFPMCTERFKYKIVPEKCNHPIPRVRWHPD